MIRRVPVRMTWLLGALGVAIAVACKGSTTPHQPALCPSYSGGVSQGDSLYGLYHLVSYCLDTLPAFTPPAESGHVTLIHATSVDSFVAVSGGIARQVSAAAERALGKRDPESHGDKPALRLVRRVEVRTVARR